MKKVLEQTEEEKIKKKGKVKKKMMIVERLTINELTDKENKLKRKEADLKNLVDGLEEFNRYTKGGKQDFTQTEMKNLVKRPNDLFYNSKWADGELIIVDTFCTHIIKPSRVETRIVAKGSFRYNLDGTTSYSDTSVEYRYFYNINDLKTELEKKVENARKELEEAKQCAFEEMKELQKYFSKNGSPDGKSSN